MKRTPLFDNAPFFHLREGDKLVRAKEAFPKNEKPWADPGKIHYYLMSKGQYYLLWTEEENGKLFLDPTYYTADCCLLFDWDMTLANATALRKLLPAEYGQSITMAQYEAIAASIRLKFPSVKVRPGYDINLEDDRLIPIPGHRVAEFQGIAYDYGRDFLYKYTVKIGPNVCSIIGETLAQGPPYVNPEELEGVHASYINAPAITTVDPETAKRAKAEYEQLVKFRKLITDVIGSPPVPR